MFAILIQVKPADHVMFYRVLNFVKNTIILLEISISIKKIIADRIPNRGISAVPVVTVPSVSRGRPTYSSKA